MTMFEMQRDSGSPLQGEQEEHYAGPPIAVGSPLGIPIPGGSLIHDSGELVRRVLRVVQPAA